VNINAVDISELKVKLGAVSPENALDFRVLNSVKLEQVWSTVGILMFPFSDPPVVTISFDCTFTVDIEMG